MIKIIFKNVGQGDSIIIEWESNGIRQIGIIDCNVYNNQNPVLEYLKLYHVKNIEFLILSHLHFDHFSGFADIFDYCIEKKIRTKLFAHTLQSFLGNIYDKIFTSQTLQRGIEHFIAKYEEFDQFIDEKILISNNIKDLELDQNILLSFLAPYGRTYEVISKQLSKQNANLTSYDLDINRLATILCIHNKSQYVLLTSDAVIKSFKNLNKKISGEAILVQAPHHGSIHNINKKFWNSITKQISCPSVFSIGDQPKHKLPNIETVEFFDTNDFDVFSTNCVYGIKEYFHQYNREIINKKSIYLNVFSNLSYNKSFEADKNGKYSGDKDFQLFN